MHKNKMSDYVWNRWVWEKECKDNLASLKQEEKKEVSGYLRNELVLSYERKKKG